MDNLVLGVGFNSVPWLGKVSKGLKPPPNRAKGGAKGGALLNGAGGKVRVSINPKFFHSCSLMWSVVGSL